MMGMISVSIYTHYISVMLPEESQLPTPDFRRDKYLAKIETIAKLRQFGLSDEQIAESLGLTLEEVKQVDSED
jgi:predicted transposase YdaD